MVDEAFWWSGGGVLKPSDSTTYQGWVLHNCFIRYFVSSEDSTRLTSIDNLPFFEDSEIAESYILSITHQLQEELVLVGIMLHIGEMYCLVMMLLVLICLILLQDCVIISAIPFVPWDSFLFYTHQDQVTVRVCMLLINAANAFNCLNRITMLLHTHVLWPRCACFCNAYRGWLMLVLRG